MSEMPNVEDDELEAIARLRMVLDSGKRYTLDELIAELQKRQDTR